jgi:hypothetical protein
VLPHADFAAFCFAAVTALTLLLLPCTLVLPHADFADLLLWVGSACSGLTQCCFDAAVAGWLLLMLAVLPLCHQLMLVTMSAAFPSPVLFAAVGLAAVGLAITDRPAAK